MLANSTNSNIYNTVILAQSLKALKEELAADRTGPDCPEFHVGTEGVSRELVPIVRDEVHHIAFEAVRNACRHAQASRIEAVIEYGDRHFRLRVSDNGKGVDSKILAEGGRTGHQGLPGMRERAALAGGTFTLRSTPEFGTEIELTIPASFAYMKSRRGSRLTRSGAC